MAHCALLLLVLYSTSTPLANGLPGVSGQDDAVLSVWGGFDARPGSPGGQILIQAGANMDIGDGRDEDLTASTRLVSVERFYRQVVPANVGPTATAPLVVTVAGNVTIHCQYLFNAYVMIEPGANLTLITGQPLWISPPSFVPYAPTELEVLPMPHTVTFANTAPGACRFQLYTTAHGDIQVAGVMGAAGGDADSPSASGGMGGSITIINDIGDVYPGTVSVSGGEGANSHDPDETGPGSAGGAGGRLAIRAKTIHLNSPILALAANGGEGGNGATWQYHKIVSDGGDGGDGGKILLEAEAIEVPDFGLPPMAVPGLAPVVADGGDGGRGGDSYDEAIPPGDGGDGGASGQVQATGTATTSVSTQPGEGGKGGDNRDGEMIGAEGATGLGTSSVPAPTLPQKTEDDWTIMLFMSADSPEVGLGDGKTSVLRALFDMEKVNLSDTSVNLLAFLDRNPAAEDMGLLGGNHYEIPYGEDWGVWSDSRRGWVTYNGEGLVSDIGTWLGGKPPYHSVLEPTNAGGELDMKNPAVLADFVKWAAKEAPAKNYALIYFGHSVGWRGVVNDTVPCPPSSTCYMALPTFGSALRQAALSLPKKRFDVFASFGCSFMCVETLAEMHGGVDYVVGSPDYVDYYDFNCTAWLEAIEASPSMTPYDLAQTIRGKASLRSGTLVQMSQIPALVRSLGQVADAVMAASPTQQKTIADTLPKQSPFAYWSDTDKDLSDVLSVLASHAGPDTAAQAAQLQIGPGKAVDGKITIYLPIPKPEPGYRLHHDYTALAFAQPSGGSVNAGWLSLLQTLYALPPTSGTP